MALCEPPVASIQTYGDAYKVAAINASRLVQCNILHNNLVKYEKALNSSNP